MTPQLIDRLLAPRRSKHRSMFGVPTQTSWATAFVFDHLLTVHREKIKWIVEIGTGRGGMSLMLALWAKVNGIPFWTIEVKSYLTDEVMSVLWHLGANIVQGDVFTGPGERILRECEVHGTGFLFCDGGNKPRELATFAPMAPPDTLIAVHDFGTETKGRHVSAVPYVEYYEPWHSESLAMNTTAAILRRV